MPLSLSPPLRSRFRGGLARGICGPEPAFFLLSLVSLYLGAL